MKINLYVWKEKLDKVLDNNHPALYHCIRNTAWFNAIDTSPFPRVREAAWDTE